MVCRHDVERALRSMISEIGPRRWRLGLFSGALDLGRCPGVAPGWYGPGLWPASLRATNPLGQSISLAPRLQPGENGRTKSRSRFNGFGAGWQTVETVRSGRAPYC